MVVLRGGLIHGNDQWKPTGTNYLVCKIQSRIICHKHILWNPTFYQKSWVSVPFLQKNTYKWPQSFNRGPCTSEADFYPYFQKSMGANDSVLFISGDGFSFRFLQQVSVFFRGATWISGRGMVILVTFSDLSTKKYFCGGIQPIQLQVCGLRYFAISSQWSSSHGFRDSERTVFLSTKEALNSMPNQQLDVFTQQLS